MTLTGIKKSVTADLRSKVPQIDLAQTGRINAAYSILFPPRTLCERVLQAAYHLNTVREQQIAVFENRDRTIELPRKYLSHMLQVVAENQSKTTPYNKRHLYDPALKLCNALARVEDIALRQECLQWWLSFPITQPASVTDMIESDIFPYNLPHHYLDDLGSRLLAAITRGKNQDRENMPQLITPRERLQNVYDVFKLQLPIEKRKAAENAASAYRVDRNTYSASGNAYPTIKNTMSGMATGFPVRKNRFS